MDVPGEGVVHRGRARHRDDAAVQELALEPGVPLEREVFVRRVSGKRARGHPLLSDRDVRV